MNQPIDDLDFALPGLMSCDVGEGRARSIGAQARDRFIRSHRAASVSWTGLLKKSWDAALEPALAAAVSSVYLTWAVLAVIELQKR